MRPVPEEPPHGLLPFCARIEAPGFRSVDCFLHPSDLVQGSKGQNIDLHRSQRFHLFMAALEGGAPVGAPCRQPSAVWVRKQRDCSRVQRDAVARSTECHAFGLCLRHAFAVSFVDPFFDPLAHRVRCRHALAGTFLPQLQQQVDLAVWHPGDARSDAKSLSFADPHPLADRSAALFAPQLHQVVLGGALMCGFDVEVEIRR